jgi:hypothetical protein
MPTTFWVQQHTGDPGTDGTANVATDTRRVSFTRNTAAGGSADNTALLEWLNNPAGENITHVTLWDDDGTPSGDVWWIGPIVGGPVLTVTGQTTEIPINTLILSLDTWT